MEIFEMELDKPLEGEGKGTSNDHNRSFAVYDEVDDSRGAFHHRHIPDHKGHPHPHPHHTRHAAHPKWDPAFPSPSSSGSSASSSTSASSISPTSSWEDGSPGQRKVMPLTTTTTTTTTPFSRARPHTTTTAAAAASPPSSGRAGEGQLPQHAEALIRKQKQQQKQQRRHQPSEVVHVPKRPWEGDQTTALSATLDVPSGSGGGGGAAAPATTALVPGAEGGGGGEERRPPNNDSIAGSATASGSSKYHQMKAKYLRSLNFNEQDVQKRVLNGRHRSMSLPVARPHLGPPPSQALLHHHQQQLGPSPSSSSSSCSPSSSSPLPSPPSEGVVVPSPVAIPIPSRRSTPAPVSPSSGGLGLSDFSLLPDSNNAKQLESSSFVPPHELVKRDTFSVWQYEKKKNAAYKAL